MFKTNKLIILNNWLLIGFREIEFPVTLGTFMIFFKCSTSSAFVLKCLWFSWCNKSIKLPKQENLHRQMSTWEDVNSVLSLTLFFQAVMRPKNLLELQQPEMAFSLSFSVFVYQHEERKSCQLQIVILQGTSERPCCFPWISPACRLLLLSRSLLWHLMLPVHLQLRAFIFSYEMYISKSTFSKSLCMLCLCCSTLKRVIQLVVCQPLQVNCVNTTPQVSSF